MKKSANKNDFTSLLFGLTDKSVEFRNRWRSLAGAAVWLMLSGFTMVLTVLSVWTQLRAQGQIPSAILIGMSLFKYVPLLAVVYSLSKKMAAKYLDDIYELDNEDLAAEFLEEVTFGYGGEKITIKEGKISENDERSPLILIGGPGEIQVNLDSVALLEKVDGEPKVIFPRNDPWELGRFERIREIGKFDEVGKREYAIINLRDQFVSGLSVKSRTKDGIPIEAQGIKVIFSLLRRQQKDDKVQGDAYLFDEAAVRALVYNQTTITPVPSTASGVAFPWDTTVIPLIISELEDLIRSRTLSEVLASISQKEVDHASSNDQTIAQMRIEMTGQQTVPGERKESQAPNFESRSRITAQFFNKQFKEKAAKLGVSVEWIDIGTWQLPSNLILDKHKEAWNLSRENAKKRDAVERSGKRHEMAEIMNLVNNVVISSYEKISTSRSSSNKEKEVSIKELEKEIKELESVVSFPEFRRQYFQQEASKSDAKVVAQEMLKAFRKELIAGKTLIENDNRPLEEKQEELARIEKALANLTMLTPHWVRPS
ncbi:MAG: hypothetical protein HY863_11090 [Chloroflexi bacterium]|nr:hypothetical protein [Chloroflexota bacterium]